MWLAVRLFHDRLLGFLLLFFLCGLLYVYSMIDYWFLFLFLFLFLFCFFGGGGGCGLLYVYSTINYI